MEAIKFNYTVPGDDFTRAGEASADLKNKLKKMGVTGAPLRNVSISLYEGEINLAIHAGGGEITALVYPDKVEMYLDDNGPGIAAEHLPHIFDRFYRVDKSRSREAGGTGLGLAIVHQLVMLHGGEIHVESEVGVGTTFMVQLPLHQG